MSSLSTRTLVASSLLLAFSATSTNGSGVPKIWDQRALEDWATPIAALNVRPANYTPAEYYATPAADNLRTYPVYRPDKEPRAYWESLQHRRPEPLVDASRMRTPADWIAAGERAFRELDIPLTRSDDPALIAMARDPKTFERVAGLADGTIQEPRWIVTDRGVMLSMVACATCHFSVTADRQIHYATPLTVAPGVGAFTVRGAFNQLARPLAQRLLGDGAEERFRRMFAAPWMPDEVDRLQRLAAQPNAMAVFISPHGVIPRDNGSPFYGTRVPDLQLLRYSRYIDATGTHRLRGAEDVGRYAAFISGANPSNFGSYRLLTAEQRRVPMRYADEVLYAIGAYLLSLEPPRNQNPPPADLVSRGEQIFHRQKCDTCHPAPNYTTGGLTPARGYVLPSGHPNARDVRNQSVGTDPGLAMRTRKGTGFYKIPSLRGLWYRPRLLHDGSITTLEELFDAARLDPDYERKGWSPPGVSKGAVPGLEFLTTLEAKDKAALIAFLRSL